MENCEECSSKDKCTKCIYGYQIQGGNCVKIEQEIMDKDHDKLMNLAIGGIVIGTIALIGVILIIVYIIWDKFFVKKNGNNNIIEYKNTPSENNVDNEVDVIQSSKKRSIHN